MKRLFAALLCGALFATTPAAMAQEEIRTEQVKFAPGTTGTTIKDTIVGRESVSYTLSAKAGQVMTVVLKPSNTATYFNVYAPGRGPGDEALAVSEMTGPMVPDMNQFRGALPETGVYTVSVYLYRSAARRNEKSNYTLDIAIAAQGGASEVPPVQGDFADGLAGGPDFWEVTGVPAGDTLNMRKGPSTKDSVVMAFANGSVLRNKGCRMEGGQRWCQVERPDDAAVRGWVAGRYLRETAAPADNGQSTDALVPGTNFNATGNMPCARATGQPMGSCEFGVVREGNGNAAVTVFWPDGGSRVIFFENGSAANYDKSETDGGAEMEVTRNADLSIITIGGQRFEIPDVVVIGD